MKTFKLFVTASQNDHLSSYLTVEDTLLFASMLKKTFKTVLDIISNKVNANQNYRTETFPDGNVLIKILGGYISEKYCLYDYLRFKARTLRS